MTAESGDRVPTTLDVDRIDDVSPGVFWLVATLCFAAGAIHLVMVPQHSQESARVGIAFAVAGWSQVAVGALMLARPRTRWILLAGAMNLVFIGVWTVSRTVGLPSWTGDGGVESASSVDVLCVVVEAVVVLVAGILLIAPSLLTKAKWTQGVLAGAIVCSLGVIVATTAVLASPSTAEHSHSTAEADHAHAEDAAHSHEGDDVAVADEHSHDTADESSPASATATTTATDATAAAAAPSATTVHSHDTSVDESGGHHHDESTITYDELPEDTKAQVDAVKAEWASKFATGADAVAGGWMKATLSLYGIGAHYVRQTGFVVPEAADFDIMEPNILLFDGEGPDARLAGVSYVTLGVPDGFIGDFDSWHAHTSACLVDGTVVSLIEEGSAVWLSEGDCLAQGGSIFPLGGGDQMMHLWIGPDYIDEGPIMSHDHPLLLDGYNPQEGG